MILKIMNQYIELPIEEVRMKTLNITEKTGKLLSIKNIVDEDDLMIITKSGVTIRMNVDGIRTMGRATQGVRLINLKGTSEIAAIARVPRGDEDEETSESEEEARATQKTMTRILKYSHYNLAQDLK